MAEVPTPSEAAGELGELARSQLADFAQAAEDYRFMIDLAVALFQDSPDAIIVADASGLIQLVNSQAEDHQRGHGEEQCREVRLTRMSRLTT